MDFALYKDVRDEKMDPNRVETEAKRNQETIFSPGARRDLNKGISSSSGEMGRDCARC